MEKKYNFNNNNFKHAKAINLSQLILASIVERLNIFLKKTRQEPLPKKFANYTLVKAVKKQGVIHAFQLGIYKDNKGKLVFVKVWNGKVKNYAYFTFRNEINIYLVLQQILRRKKDTMPAQFENVTIPKLITFFETSNSLILVLEYVSGKIIQDLPSEKKLLPYLKIVDFLKYLGENMTKKERSLLSSRGAYFYIKIYPFLVIKALVTNPRAAKSILRGVPTFILSIPAILRSNNQVLVHKDLHFKNIMLSENKIVLVDLQLCAFANKYHDYVTSLRMRWNEERIHVLLLSEMKKRFGKDKDFNTLIKGLIVHNATHGLTGCQFSRKKIDYWIDYLNFGRNLKNKQFDYKNL